MEDAIETSWATGDCVFLRLEERASNLVTLAGRLKSPGLCGAERPSLSDGLLFGLGAWAGGLSRSGAVLLVLRSVAVKAGIPPRPRFSQGALRACESCNCLWTPFRGKIGEEIEVDLEASDYSFGKRKNVKFLKQIEFCQSNLFF